MIEHPHVRSLELQVSEIQHPLHAEIETDFFCGHWQGTPLGAMGGASLRRCCAPRARDAQQWPSPYLRPPALARALLRPAPPPARGLFAVAGQE